MLHTMHKLNDMGDATANVELAADPPVPQQEPPALAQANGPDDLPTDYAHQQEIHLAQKPSRRWRHPYQFMLKTRHHTVTDTSETLWIELSLQ